MWRYIRPKKVRVYLDHAAATPLRDKVKQAMREVEGLYGNPSAIHKEGVQARVAVETARQRLATCLKVRPEQVHFTASGTESNNLAILGTVEREYSAGRSYEEMEIITTPIEHPSVSKAVAALRKKGVTVKELSVDEEGMIDLGHLKTLLSSRTVLVTCAYVNSEIGTVQPISKLCRTVRAFAYEHDVAIGVHVDAAQAPDWLPCQTDRIPVDLLSLDAAKCGGPKGVGVLVCRHGAELSPVMFGGSQEAGLRPGTENVVGIVGAVEAIVLAQEAHEAQSTKVAKLRDTLQQALLSLPNVVQNSPQQAAVANSVNVSVLGVDSEFLTISLDEAGVATSTKSACAGASGGGSAVVLATRGDAARAQATLRLTLSPHTTHKEVKIAIARLAEVIMTLQQQSAQFKATQ